LLKKKNDTFTINHGKATFYKLIGDILQDLHFGNPFMLTKIQTNVRDDKIILRIYEILKYI
jgi:hypothetical protein